MNAKSFMLLYALLLITGVQSGEKKGRITVINPKILDSFAKCNPLLAKSVVEERREYAAELGYEESEVKIFFKDVDISDQKKTFYELGVSFYTDLEFKILKKNNS